MNANEDEANGCARTHKVAAAAAATLSAKGAKRIQFALEKREKKFVVRELKSSKFSCLVVYSLSRSAAKINDAQKANNNSNVV